MSEPYERLDEQEELRQKVLGLGETSLRKSYFPQLQARLRELERFRTLLDHSNDAIFLLEASTGRIVDANESACRQLATRRKDLLSAPFLELLATPDAQSQMKAVLAHVNQQSRHTLFFPLKARDGREFPAEVTLIIKKFDDILYCAAVARDYSDRRRAEEALRKSEAKFRRLVEQLPLITYMMSPKASSHTLYISPQVGQITGYSAGAFAGNRQLWLRIVHPQDVERYKVEFERACSSSEPFLSEYRIVSRDGRTLWIRDEAILVKDAQGRPYFYQGIRQDITVQKRNAEALKEERELFMSGPTVVFKWRAVAGGPVEYVSPNVEEQFGYRPETFTRDNLRYDAVIHPDDLQRVLGELQHYRQRKIERFEQKYRIRRADGEYRWVDDFTVLVRDAKGEVTHYHGYVLDVTDRIAAEEERKGLEERFHRSQRLESLGLLAGGIAHDFNNLLVGILGNVDLALMDPALPEKSRSHLQNIRSATLRTADLTNQMLAYSGRGSFVVEMLDLTTLVNEMARLLRTSISRKIEIRHERIGDEAPVIKGDPTSIRQVVMNLILNAADAIGDRPGTITVSTGIRTIDDQWLKKAYVVEHRAPGKHAILQVRDTGSGMDETTAAKLFEPFFTTKSKGRGLGLSAVLGIVRSHHGAIRVDTEPGKGTTFTVAFSPALASNHEQAPVDADKGRDAGLGEGLILVVDDDESVRRVAVAMLQMQGFEVLQAVDGREAIAVFREKAADIRGVLLDMTMPDMNGEEVFRVLHSIRDDIKVAVVSGYGEQDTREKFGNLQLSAFIPKPFSQETLIQGVRAMLNQ